MSAMRASPINRCRRAVLALGAALLSAACAARPAASAALVDLQVVDRDSGQVLQRYARGERLYVAGRPGARYGLRVRNTTSGRVLVVLSVDGVNIVTGQTADVGQSGYVLDPWRTYELDGWRKSDTQIAAFEFAPVDQSYAARTGRAADVGVIGMAVFLERAVSRAPDTAVPSVSDRRSLHGRETQASAGAAAPGASNEAAKASPDAVPSPPGTAAAPRPSPGEAMSRPADAAAAGAEGRSAPVQQASRLGTAHGAREWSVSETTEFERLTRAPQRVLSIEYDTFERLVDAGVIPRPASGRRPDPFPANRGEVGFVADPPGAR